MAYCGWPGPSGLAGVGGGGLAEGEGRVSLVGGAMWLGAALSFYGNFPDIS